MIENDVNYKEIVLGFNIENHGTRKFFSINERNNGDLLLIPKYSEYVRELTKEPDNIKQIKQQKYSIHCSPKSKEFNVCMFNLELSNGEIHRLPQYTKTIKSGSGKLTALYFSQSPDLSIEKYKLDGKDQDKFICLDKFNSRVNTLYYGIFICSKSTKSFLCFKNGQQNYRTFNFLNFTILVVWTYQFLPSSYLGSFMHVVSFDDHETDYPNNTPEGLTGLEAKNIATNLFNSLKQEYFLTLINSEILTAEKYNILSPLPFKKNAYCLKQ